MFEVSMKCIKCNSERVQKDGNSNGKQRYKCLDCKKRFDWCIDIVKRELNRYDNIRFVDGFTLMPHVEECCCDKLHPNEYGCLLLAQSIYKEIKKFKF